MKQLVPALLVALATIVAVSPAFAQPAEDTLRISAPNAMVAGKTFTLRADILDPEGEIDWDVWSAIGTVSMTRVADGTSIPTSITVFDTHLGVPATDSIRFYSGVGSVSITLDGGAATAGGLADVHVSVGPLTASRRINILNNPQELVLSGSLSGPNLIWEPSKGVIHITGDCTVPANRVLQIHPGTLIMIDAGLPNDGTLITVFGRVEAMGTEAAPIFFFPTSGAPALHLQALCSETVYNPHAFRGILHYGSQRSIYDHCFVTGGGNFEPTGHTQAPVWHFAQSHGADIDDCVFVDIPGKAIYGTPVGNPVFNLRNNLISRCGHGVEFTESGDYTLLAECCIFSGIGHGAASCDRKGDCINVRGEDIANGGPKVIRGCLFTDTKDDCIDEKTCDMLVENCIMYDNGDCGITMEAFAGGRMVANNLLIFRTGRCFSGRGTHVDMTNCTLIGLEGNPRTFLHPSCDASVLRKNIFDGGGVVDCCADVQYCIINRSPNDPCGLNNSLIDPDLDPLTYDLIPDPPLRDSGPNGEMIGWLGWFKNPPVIATGACCAADGSCADLSESQCAATGGIYHGDASSCGTTNCPPPPPATGACCMPNGSCAIHTAPACAAIGGVYEGDFIDCVTAACEQPHGACCLPDGSCTSGTAAECATAGGTYQGDNIDCGAANCPQPSGACCLPNGACSDGTSAACAAAGGAYEGDFTMCALTTCPEPVGACCASDGSCSSVTEADCAGTGGTYEGDGVACIAANCPILLGRCCHSDGSCTNVVEGDCGAMGGIFAGAGTECGAIECPQPMGACCLADGSCEVLHEGDCTVLGGAYQGDSTDCGTANCPQPNGACCMSDGSCIEVSEESCTLAGATFEGDFTTCGDSDCAPACPCDWNQADGLDSQDFFDFLNDFFNGTADFNGFDGTDSQDLFDFFDCFFTGC